MEYSFVSVVYGVIINVAVHCFSSEAVTDGELISLEVQRYAHERDLIALPFYHNEPNWLVHEKEPVASGFVRQLQLSVGLQNGMQTLYFIPSLYYLDRSESKLAVLRQTPPHLIIRELLQTVLNQHLTLQYLESAWGNTEFLMEAYGKSRIYEPDTFIWTQLSEQQRQIA